jgi:hypothetical protein
MKRWVLALMFVGLIVYGVGPRLVAPLSDVAGSRCLDFSQDSDTAGIKWRLFPVAGWVCTYDDQPDRYLGWWVR